MTCPTPSELLLQSLLADDTVTVGQCRLLRNTVCDCILGTDPLGVDAVAAFDAGIDGCRAAIAWAYRRNAAAAACAPARVDACPVV